jgi:hypothetical protein
MHEVLSKGGKDMAAALVGFNANSDHMDRRCISVDYRLLSACKCASGGGFWGRHSTLRLWYWYSSPP